MELDGDTAAELWHRYLWDDAIDQLLADEAVDGGGAEDVLWPVFCQIVRISRTRHS